MIWPMPFISYQLFLHLLQCIYFEWMLNYVLWCYDVKIKFHKIHTYILPSKDHKSCISIQVNSQFTWKLLDVMKLMLWIEYSLFKSTWKLQKRISNVTLVNDDEKLDLLNFSFFNQIEEAWRNKHITPSINNYYDLHQCSAFLINYFNIYFHLLQCRYFEWTLKSFWC